jgi:hypothetical protein
MPFPYIQAGRSVLHGASARTIFPSGEHRRIRLRCCSADVPGSDAFEPRWFDEGLGGPSTWTLRFTPPVAPPALSERLHRGLARSAQSFLEFFRILPPPSRRFLAGDEPT